MHSLSPDDRKVSACAEICQTCGSQLLTLFCPAYSFQHEAKSVKCSTPPYLMLHVNVMSTSIFATEMGSLLQGKRLSEFFYIV